MGHPATSACDELQVEHDVQDDPHDAVQRREPERDVGVLRTRPPLARVQRQVIHGGVVMPAFQNVLTSAQIKAVAKFVASHAGKK